VAGRLIGGLPIGQESSHPDDALAKARSPDGSMIAWRRSVAMKQNWSIGRFTVFLNYAFVRVVFC
jgi:hypothetical protein